jgi:hypothetical protein
VCIIILIDKSDASADLIEISAKLPAKKAVKLGNLNEDFKSLKLCLD